MELTKEQIEKTYSAALDSVNLINGEKPEDFSDEEWVDAIKRNQEHLKLVLEKDCWTTEDLQPIQDAASKPVE